MWGLFKIQSMVTLFGWIAFVSGFSFAQAQSDNSTSSVISTKTPETKSEYARKMSGALKVTTLGRQIRDENLKSSIGWTFVEASLGSEFNSWLKFDIGLLGVFGEGAAQNYLSSEGAGTNILILDNATLTVTPIKPLSLRAGVISYQLNPLYTSVTPGTSLGADQKLELATPAEMAKITFQGTEAIPSNGVNKGMVEKDKAPFYLGGSVTGELKLQPVTLKASSTKFQFGNIPKGVAQDALTGGNSIESVSGAGSDQQYVIGFAGTESAAVAEVEWSSKVKMILKGLYIINERAFVDADEGRSYKGSFEITLGNVKLTPSYTMFEIESDVSPAGYTILVNRYNNRKGQSAGLAVDLIKEKVGFFGSYTKADEIKPSPYLSNREYFNLGVEVSYDVF